MIRIVSILAYPSGMPRLWTQTIATHRREVRDAILDAAAAAVATRGLRAVTMSQIAQDTGIGRATLYKYFSGVDEILLAWHERQVVAHLDQLTEIAHRPGSGRGRLEAVLGTYAQINRQRGRHHGSQLLTSEVTVSLHEGSHLAPAYLQLHGLIEDLLDEAARGGEIRDDIPPAELATFCLHALDAAPTLPSQAAAKRLVTTILAGLGTSD